VLKGAEASKLRDRSANSSSQEKVGTLFSGLKEGGDQGQETFCGFNETDP